MTSFAANTEGSKMGLDYAKKVPELSALLTGKWITDLANFAAFVFAELPDLNWAGFYLSDDTQLILGPFCGKPACTEIAFSRGVCGASFTKGEAMIVDDVHEFPGHIACDAASNAELVLPIIVKGRKIGVLDLDSPTKKRFTLKDKEGLELWLKALIAAVPESVWENKPWKN